jgi:3-(3-hydroxy-phenyl)propionate hydroxylase
MIDSYDTERRHGAAENILNSARATSFMTPKSPIEALFRSETLRMAHDQPFARELINSGRLSQPCSLAGFPLQTDSGGPCAAGNRHARCAGRGYVADLARAGRVHAGGFGGVHLPDVPGIRRIGIAQREAHYPCYGDMSGYALGRYGMGQAYLFRPDGHVAAVFSTPTVAGVRGGPRPCARPQTRPVGGRLMTQRTRSIHASGFAGRGDDDLRSPSGGP